MTISPEDYSAWMRLRLPELNKNIDDDESLNSILAEESVRACRSIADRCVAERERFTYLSMLHAALHLLEAYNHREDGSPDVLRTLLQSVAYDLQQIVDWNRELAHSLDREEFRAMTEYFNEVEVGGRIMRGVNAGDQPWSYIID